MWSGSLCFEFLLGIPPSRTTSARAMGNQQLHQAVIQELKNIEVDRAFEKEKLHNMKDNRGSTSAAVCSSQKTMSASSGGVFSSYRSKPKQREGEAGRSDGPVCAAPESPKIRAGTDLNKVDLTSLDSDGIRKLLSQSRDDSKARSSASKLKGSIILPCVTPLSASETQRNSLSMPTSAGANQPLRTTRQQRK